MDDSPMDSDPKSMNNATCDFENKRDDNQPNDQKLKQQVQDLDDNQPQDLKMNQEVVYLHSLHPLSQMEKSSKIGNLEGRERQDREEESSKRTRIEESPAVIVQYSDPSMESLKLIEEIVTIYGYHVDHVIEEAKYGIKDEQISNLDRTMCGGVGETFAQKIRRLGCELERMKNDDDQFKDYMFIQPRVTQIMSQLLMIHQLFDPSSKSRVYTDKHKMDEFRKEVDAVKLRIDETKTLQVYRKTMEERRRYFRI